MHSPPHSFAASQSIDGGAVLAGAMARQAVTPTALVQARLPERARVDGPFAPADCAFARDVARSFTGWKDG